MNISNTLFNFVKWGTSYNHKLVTHLLSFDHKILIYENNNVYGGHLGFLNNKKNFLTLPHPEKKK